MNTPQSLPILLVDDEAPILKASSLMLQGRGYDNIITVQDSRKVMPLLASQPVAVAVIDLFMPEISGQELLTQIACNFPEIVVIIQTALDETQSAVECMRKGAFDYIVKPVESARLAATVSRALEVHALHVRFQLSRNTC